MRSLFSNWLSEQPGSGYRPVVATTLATGLGGTLGFHGARLVQTSYLLPVAAVCATGTKDLINNRLIHLTPESRAVIVAVIFR